MTTWDRRSPRTQAALQRSLLRAQLRSSVAPFSPYWRSRSRAAGRDLAGVEDIEDFAGIPAVGERDVCADGDPAAAARLVLQADEEAYVLAGDGPAVRRAVVRRVFAPRSYRALLEADTRPVSYVMAGLGLRFPVASTRGDLDVLARAGARLWAVLGLTGRDVVVSGLAVAATTEHRGLEYAALAGGSPALFPGPEELDATLALVPATVLALPSDTAAAQLAALTRSRLAAVSTLLLVGAPTPEERAAATAALDRPDAAVLGVHAPTAARLLWGECRESAGRDTDAGYHSYPDFEVLQTVDAETGESGGIDAVELVLTQLQLKGSALVRWRTGDIVADEPHVGACPACGRTVPRLVDLRRAALVPRIAPRRSDPVSVDLREVAGALTGRSDLADWSVVLGRSARDGADELLVHIAVDGAAAAAEVAVAVARDIGTAAGIVPSQVVLGDAGALPSGEDAVTRRISRQR